MDGWMDWIDGSLDGAYRQQRGGKWCVCGGEVGLRMRPKGRHFRRRNLLPGPGQTQK